MTSAQLLAIRNHCRLVVETTHPRFSSVAHSFAYSLVLVVDSGYEWPERGFEGPVWRASAMSHKLSSIDELYDVVYGALEGVGNASLGEWCEMHGGVVHLRRRLSAKEQFSVGPAVDIRGTDEQVRRMRKAWRAVPAVWGMAE